MSYLSNSSARDYIQLQDQKANTTQGGTATAGSWATRDLNTEVKDTGGDASISANQFTLQPGTYTYFAVAQFYQTDNVRIKLRNITDSTDENIGNNAYSGEAVNHGVPAFLSGRFEITAAKTFEIQYRCQTTQATNGLGTNSSFGEVETYLDLQLWKE